jgi:MFS family permease
MMGQSIGPIFGGIISEYFGYHAIFWFLLCFGSLALMLIILLLPETLRTIAGNGTIALSPIHRPLIDVIRPSSDAVIPPTRSPPKKISIRDIFSPLKFLFEKDVFITLLYGALIYTIWSMVTSSTTALLQPEYQLSQLQTGLVFLPNGAGCVLGSILTGYLMDHDYKHYETIYRTTHSMPADTPLAKPDLHDFPFERSRLRNAWWLITIFVLATSAYGFSLLLSIIAIPLTLQFFIAYTATAIFTLNSALVVDLYPSKAASATAVNNLMRCSLGAAGVAVVQEIVNGIGAGRAFLAFGIIAAAFAPLLVVEWFWGEGWRGQRRVKLEMKEKVKAEKEKGGDLEGSGATERM